MTMMNFIILILKTLFSQNQGDCARNYTPPSYFFEKYKSVAFLIKISYRLLYKMADMVICPSQIMIEELKSIKGMKTCTFRKLYNPVVTIRPEFINTKRMKQKLFLFLLVALISKRGLILFYEQLTAHIFKFDWRWDIVGEGPEEPILKN